MSIDTFKRPQAKRPQCQRGMTLIELVMAIVIISVGLAGVLIVFSTTVKSSADPMVHKQMLASAEEMMEEIMLKPYAPTSSHSGCSVRNTFIGVNDYNGYACSGIYDVDGNAISALAGYSISVAVVLDAATFSSYSVTDARKITVTVTHGSESISLVGWRTNYAS